MITKLDNNVLDLSAVQRCWLQKTTSSFSTVTHSDVAGKQDNYLEQKLEEITEELKAVLLDRDTLLGLSNRLRADLQRALRWHRCINVARTPEKENELLFESYKDDGKLDWIEMRPSCQSAALLNDQLQHKTLLPAKTSDRTTQSQKKSLERIQKRRETENLRQTAKNIAKVRNWNVRCGEWDYDGIHAE